MDLSAAASAPRVGTGLLLIREDGYVLFYRRKTSPEAGFWNIPGGKIDFLEHSAAAAKREAEEETGLTIGSVRFLCASEHLFAEDKQHWVSMIYATMEFSGTASLTEPDKFHEFGWFHITDPPQPLSRFATDALREAMKLCPGQSS